MGLKSFLLGTVGALLLLASASVAQADTGFGTLASPPFGTGGAVAIDQSTGSVYVVNPSQNRVEQFDASGNLTSMFGKEGPGKGQFKTPSGIAVDQSTHDVYVVDESNQRVERFDSSGNYLSQFGVEGNLGTGAGDLNAPGGAAVDAGGDVYIADSGNGRVQKFDSTGRFVLAFGWGVSDGREQLETCVSTCQAGIGGTGNGQFEKPVGVAVDSTGAVYVADGEAGRVQKFDSSGNYLTTLDTGGSPRALAVDSSNDLYIGDNSGEPHVLQLDSSGTTIDNFGVGQIGEVLGIAVNSSLVRVYVANANGVAPFGLTTLPHSTTGAAPSVTATSAEVSGTVNPESIEATYHFEYGLDTSYRTGCSSPPCISPQPDNSAGSGSSEVPVEPPVALTELEPNATYHYRLVATNSSGSTYGADRTFLTLPAPPSVDGQSATPSATSATLNAQINPENEETSDVFEYATSEAALLEGKGTKAAGAPLNGYPEQHGSVTVTGLAPGTTYFYRVVAENLQSKEEAIPVLGPPQSFTTLPPAPIPITGLASPLARTAATLNGTVNPEGSDTTYYFQYGTDTSYKIPVPGKPVPQPGIVPKPPTDIGSESIPLAATAEATGLEPNTIYHFRLVAANDSGQDTVYGADQTFTTVALAPAVTTGLVVEATATTATLGGGIVPEGVDTRYHFEWGTTTAYGSDVPAPDGDAGSAVNTQNVTAGISGLAPGTTYHYRLVATSSGGTTYGWDQTLTTSAPVPPASTSPAAASNGGQSAPIVPFPNLSGFTPMPQPKASTIPKALTNAQKLTKALKACRKQPKRKRAACVKRARRQYATSTPAKHRAKTVKT
jgi:hypothetical protein